MSDAGQLPTLLTVIVQRYLPKGSEARPFPDDRDLFELGLDSLNAVRMLLEIEEAFGIAFPEEEIKAELFSSVKSLNDAILQQLELSRT
jgi:acyl carrier protein